MTIPQLLGTFVGSVIRHARRPAERFWFAAIVFGLAYLHGLGIVMIPFVGTFPFRVSFFGNWSYGPLAWPTTVLFAATVASLVLLRFAYKRPLLPYVGLIVIGLAIMVTGAGIYLYTPFPGLVALTFGLFGLVLAGVSFWQYRQSQDQRGVVA